VRSLKEYAVNMSQLKAGDNFYTKMSFVQFLILEIIEDSVSPIAAVVCNVRIHSID
jgi:hypothetical protein